MQSQPSRKKAFLTQATGGYILTAIAMVKGLFLLPIYFKFISYEMYGYWITIGSIIGLLSIVNYGLGTMVTQRISKAYAKNDLDAVGDYFISSIVIYTVISFVFLSFGYVLSLYIQSMFKVSNENMEILNTAFCILLITTSITFFSSAFRGFSQSLLKPLFSVYVMVGSNILGVVMVLVFLYNDLGLLSLPISGLITELLIVVLCGIYVKVLFNKFNIKSKIKISIIKEYLSFSPHLIKLVIGNKALENSHPILITTFLGAELTTAYDVTRKVIEIILKMLNVLNASLLAPFSHLVGQGDKKLIKQNLIKIVMFSFLVGIIGYGTYIATNEMFIALWINQEVALSQSVIVAIGISAFVFSMNRLFRNLLFGFDEIKFASHSVLTEGLVYVGLSIIFINIFGIIAIPLSFLIASSYFAFILWKKLAYLSGISVSTRESIKAIILLTLVSLFLYIEQNYLNTISWIAFIIKVIIISISIIAIEWIIYNKNLKQFIKRKSI